MSEATHTPGPWVVGEVIVNGDHPIDETAIIFLPDGGEIEIGTKHSVADAHLIASAPDLLAERDHLREVNAEMLAALKSILFAPYETSGLAEIRQGMEARERIRKIIAKAEAAP